MSVRAVLLGLPLLLGVYKGHALPKISDLIAIEGAHKDLLDSFFIACHQDLNPNTDSMYFSVIALDTLTLTNSEQCMYHCALGVYYTKVFDIQSASNHL